MPTTEFTTAGIITLVAGSSVLAAFVTQGVSWLRDYLNRSQEEAFARLYIVAALEAYASVAARAISDSEIYEVSNGEAGTHWHNIPDFPPYPDMIDWKALGTKLTKLALAFPVDIEAAQALIAFEWDVVNDHELVLPTVREKTARAGARALQLAAKLQDEYEGEKVQLLEEIWDSKTQLETKLHEYTDKRIRSQEESDAFLAESQAKANRRMKARKAQEPHASL
jgi:hypothetical protein